MLFHASDYDENDNYDVSNDKKKGVKRGEREKRFHVFVLHSLACNAFIISEVVFLERVKREFVLKLLLLLLLPYVWMYECLFLFLFPYNDYFSHACLQKIYLAKLFAFLFLLLLL